MNQPPPLPGASVTEGACPFCAYDLRGAPMADLHVTCPECGHRFDSAELRQIRVIPAPLPSLLLMILPAWGAAIVSVLLLATLYPNPTPGLTVWCAAAGWALVMPWFIVRARAARIGQGYIQVLLMEEGFVGCVLACIGVFSCLCVGLR